MDTHTNDKEGVNIMALPLIPIIAALSAGGSLVPHAAGGMIVSGAGGYIAGTYLSTAAIAGLVTTATGTVGAGALYLSGMASSLASSAAGVFGAKSAGAGALAAVTGTASTPLLVPLAACGAAIGVGLIGFKMYQFKRKLKTADGSEAQFTEKEAKMIENMIKRLPYKQ